jgi:hypothetical protein
MVDWTLNTEVAVGAPQDGMPDGMLGGEVIRRSARVAWYPVADEAPYRGMGRARRGERQAAVKQA